MRRFTNFLKQSLTSTGIGRLPATSAEMSFHDALRICAGTVSRDERARSTVAPRTKVCWYSSEPSLHNQ